jgi:hypothetical protein
VDVGWGLRLAGNSQKNTKGGSEVSHTAFDEGRGAKVERCRSAKGFALQL